LDQPACWIKPLRSHDAWAPLTASRPAARNRPAAWLLADVSQAADGGKDFFRAAAAAPHGSSGISAKVYGQMRTRRRPRQPRLGRKRTGAEMRDRMNRRLDNRNRKAEFGDPGLLSGLAPQRPGGPHLRDPPGHSASVPRGLAPLQNRPAILPITRCGYLPGAGISRRARSYAAAFSALTIAL